MEVRDIREQVFVATKVRSLDSRRKTSSDRYFLQYTQGWKKLDDSVKQKINYVGNNLKSMNVSVDASLKKLRTSYIDLLYVHWWDHETPIEEVMNGLHSLVAQGKVLYLVCNSFIPLTQTETH